MQQPVIEKEVVVVTLTTTSQKIRKSETVAIVTSKGTEQPVIIFFSKMKGLLLSSSSCILIVVVALVTGAHSAGQQATPNFKCPENNGFFPDPKQCDKYYECQDNIPEEKLCPDGLLFEVKNPNHERCDLPFNVDCGDRTELQSAVSTVQCPRKNGYFSHEDPQVCDKFYNCVDGVANVVPCPSGLIYDDYQGTCTWPESAQRQGCEKENRKKDKLPDGFSCPDGDVLGNNGRPLPHPTYPHPEDCQKFYICRNGIQPQLGSCPPGTVYSESNLKCEDPEGVPGCEKWFDEDAKN